MSILVIDAGTSSIRASIVTDEGTIANVCSQPLLPSTPMEGYVEINPKALAEAALDVAASAIQEAGRVSTVAITNQRATTIVWNRKTGEPYPIGLGWQDLRTVINCLMLKESGFRFAPNMTATKAAELLNMADPDRSGDWLVGTVDSWLVWVLSGGEAHITDATNAGVTGLVSADATAWSQPHLDALNIPAESMPRITDSSGDLAVASKLPGSPVIRGIAGDQQASMIGQGCVVGGSAKITFGTGGMLDTPVASRPEFEQRGAQGTFPIVSWRLNGETKWGIEGAILSAGTCVEWLRDDLGLISSAQESDKVAAECTDTKGVYFVPALMGLGTPYWDFGARGLFAGISAATGKAEIVRAVLEGIAQRGADLVEAAEADPGTTIESLRIDGGMSANRTFLIALANATGRALEVSPITEATTLGAAYLAGIATGTWRDLEETAGLWKPGFTIEPSGDSGRDRWKEALERAKRTIPDLSSVEF